jgi:uncharacterized membrane protein YfcA
MGGLAFTALYLLHRVLQGTGPESSTAAAVAAYTVAHRGVLLASEVAVGLALLAFIPFLAALVPVIWRAGQEPLAVAVAVSGGVFAITALVAVLSLAIYRTGVVGRWLGVVGLVAAVGFLLGSVFSVLGRTPEGARPLSGSASSSSGCSCSAPPCGAPGQPAPPRAHRLLSNLV